LNNVKNKLESSRPAAPPRTSRNDPPASSPSAGSEEKRIIIDIVGLMIKGKTIVSVIADSPAARAGLKKGDLIVSIDGVPAGSSEQNASHLSGKAETSVLLKVKRGEKELVVPVIRENP
jgi:C-terminal processing protease CtpA/Prc